MDAATIVGTVARAQGGAQRVAETPELRNAPSPSRDSATARRHSRTACLVGLRQRCRRIGDSAADGQTAQTARSAPRLRGTAEMGNHRQRAPLAAYSYRWRDPRAVARSGTVLRRVPGRSRRRAAEVGHDNRARSRQPPPQLTWMSATARALLALAWADGKPLRVISNVDDAVTLVRAEHLVRSAHLGLRDALEQALPT